ncbi:44482_t:CDS:1 [Gigaspora margarita]|uniref:44482_t:CDS:1 n=1 Tax=Gigaspora margarita TaxID=4874 RepID=A0ABN7VF73_GIGMA|nr:44482_t:CDS:1 [Gigaspora margarita]
MQQFITQQAETQYKWNAQVLESINQKLAHRESANINESGQFKSSYNNAQSDNNQQRTSTSGNNNGAVQSNYLSTLIINSLLLALGIEDQAIEPAVNNKTVSYKATGRKFLSFVYKFKDNTQEIQGFINEKAIKTEQICL